MVDDVRRVKGPTIPTVKPRDAGEIPGKGVRELLTQLPTGKDPKGADEALQKVANLIRGLGGVQKNAWKQAKVKALVAAIKNALSKKSSKAAAMEHVDAWAVESATKETRMQLRQWVGYIGITADDGETDGLRELAKLLWPQTNKGKGSSFKRGTALKGAVKSEVVAKLIDDAVQEASRLAGKRLLGDVVQGQKLTSEALNQFARMSLEQMSRALKRKLRKKEKKKKDKETDEVEDHARVEAIEGGEAEADEEDNENELDRMLDLLCDRGLDTMHLVRDEIAPRWASEQQPFLLREAKQHVVDILLATAEREQLAQTEAWEEVQAERDNLAPSEPTSTEEVTRTMIRR